MQYPDNNQFLLVRYIDDNKREPGNNKFSCAAFASTFSDGRVVGQHLCGFDDFIYRSNRSRWIVLSNILLHLVKIAIRSFSPEYSHCLAAQRFTTSE